MAQLLVRQLDDDVKQRLQERAAKHGVSMEEEVRMILRATVLKDDGQEFGLGTRIAELFRDIPGNDEPLPEFPRQPFKPVDFGE
ncbi:toxin-antitoxin system [Mesorhizobium sp. DCY119]|uniref:FitA-like ribbon-helix-helix domain-containing protein n=1 Tax=Mesorhizobium sp. DCY119 TaxID=2108445 RepID=UPI000E6D0C69|nr:toxin-antitoxin system [Mesorhizobium sp. DCY119]RJG43611.1 toxin-antitoxin system [Mesorhizobium sp. DCY119]